MNVSPLSVPPLTNSIKVSFVAAFELLKFSASVLAIFFIPSAFAKPLVIPISLFNRSIANIRIATLPINLLPLLSFMISSLFPYGDFFMNKSNGVNGYLIILSEAFDGFAWSSSFFCRFCMEILAACINELAISIPLNNPFTKSASTNSCDTFPTHSSSFLTIPSLPITSLVTLGNGGTVSLFEFMSGQFPLLPTVTFNSLTFLPCAESTVLYIMYINVSI